MAIENKYRVKDVATDFGKTTKEITEILTKYADTPKSSMQALNDKELSMIFEVITQNEQVDNMEKALNIKGGKEEKKVTEVAQKTENQEAPRSTKVKQVHRIDTRGGGDVNLDKYDERIDSLVSEKAERMQSTGQKKQKLTKKSDQRARQQYGSKRKLEEQEKMKRLQRPTFQIHLCFRFQFKHPIIDAVPVETSFHEFRNNLVATGLRVGIAEASCIGSNSQIQTLGNLLIY